MGELLHDHVERFNAGVRSGDWAPMLETFRDDGEMAGRIEASYAWLNESDVAAGELLITPRDVKIAKLIVTFDRGVVWS